MTGHAGDGADDGSACHVVTHDGEGPVAVTVALAVADLDGVDPATMEPLSAAVDPSVLDAVVGDERILDASITFRYRRYRVTVVADGDVHLDPVSPQGST